MPCKYQMAVFNPEGAGSALMTVVALATLTLVLPRFTTTHPGPEFSSAQLAFAAVASLGALRHLRVHPDREAPRLLPAGRQRPGSANGDWPVSGRSTDRSTDDDGHADPPSDRAALASLALLLLGLVAVVGLAKVESYPIEDGRRAPSASRTPSSVS